MVFIFRYCSSADEGNFCGLKVGGGIMWWREDGTADGSSAIIRCLDDQPELVDLTKIDVRFGELDERTQDRLVGAMARGAEAQVKALSTFRKMAWFEERVLQPQWIIRLKPEEPTYTMPTVDDKVWLALPGAKSITWDSGATNPYAHAKSNPDKVEHYGQWIDGDELPANLLGDIIQRGDCPWDQAIVRRPEGL